MNNTAIKRFQIHSKILSQNHQKVNQIPFSSIYFPPPEHSLYLVFGLCIAFSPIIYEFPYSVQPFLLLLRAAIFFGYQLKSINRKPGNMNECQYTSKMRNETPNPFHSPSFALNPAARFNLYYENRICHS